MTPLLASFLPSFLSSFLPHSSPEPEKTFLILWDSFSFLSFPLALRPTDQGPHPGELGAIMPRKHNYDGKKGHSAEDSTSFVRNVVNFSGDISRRCLWPSTRSANVANSTQMNNERLRNGANCMAIFSVIYSH